MRPPNGTIKLNSDTAVSKAGCEIGFVARDEFGVALFLGTKRISSGDDVEVAEAEAMLWALQCAADCGVCSVIAESDSLSLISKLRRNVSWMGPLGWFLREIRAMQRRFVSCKWSHVRKSGNCPAHLLVGLKSDFAFTCDFYLSFSAHLNSLLEADLLN